MKSIIKERLEEIEKGIVPEGYKETKMGIIPEDWDVKSLEKVCEIGTGNKDTQDKEDDGKYPFFVRSNNIERINSYSYDGESILTAGDGVGTGKVFHYINEKFDYHQRVYCLNEFKNIKGKYLFYYFSKNFIRQVVKYSAKTSVDSVRREMLTKMKIPIAPLQEQEKIADILSTWDKAIENIEKLIKEKEIQKKGLVQQLLTGKTRLPGFSGEWEEVKLEEVANISLGLTYTPTYTKSGVPFLSVKDINKGKVDITDIKYISREEFENATENAKPKKGDILFGRVGTLGNPIVIEQDMEFAIFVSLGYLRINKEVITVYFMKHWMDSDLFERQVTAIVAGSSQKNLNTGWLKKFKLNLPPLEEKKAIAEILSTADKEIELLNKLLEYKKEEKKGLMQLLLTGIVRV